MPLVPAKRILLFVAAIYFSTGALLPLVSRGQLSGFEAAANFDASGSVISQAVWLALYVGAIATLGHLSTFSRAIRQGPAVCYAVVMLAMCSAIWSADGDLTIRKAVALAGTTAIAIALRHLGSDEAVVRVFAWAAALVTASSLFVVIALPALGTYSEPRGLFWNGVYTSKNELGFHAAWSILAMGVSALRVTGFMPRLGWWTGVAGGTILLVGSGSAGALAAVTAGLFALALPILLRRTTSLAAALLATLGGAGLLIAAILPTILEDLTGLLGRDPTLTGRIYIWSAAWAAIKEHAILGYGFSAFWGDVNSPAREIWANTAFVFGNRLTVPSAHNAWLDVWLELGLVGVLLLVGVLMAATRGLASASDRSGQWAIPGLLSAIFVTTLVYNTVDGAFLKPNAFAWLFLTLLATRASDVRTSWTKAPFNVRDSILMLTNSDPDPSPDALSLRRVSSTIRHRWRWLAGTVILFVAMAIAVTGLATPRYTATSVLLAGQGNGLSDIQAALEASQATRSLGTMADDQIVVEKALNRLSLDDDPEDVLKNVAAHVPANSQNIEISVTDTDPAKAKLLANAMAEAFSELVKDHSDVDTNLSASVWQFASRPKNPSSPRVAFNMALGLLIGVFAGLAAAFVRDYRDQTWRSEGDVENRTGLSVLVTVPVFSSSSGKRTA